MTSSSAALFSAKQRLSIDAPSGAESAHPLSVVVWETLGAPFQIDVNVRSSTELKAAQVLGQPMAVNVNLGVLPARHFHGLVSEMAFLTGDENSVGYRITLRPWLWFLSRAGDCRIFQQKTVPDILKEVFRAHGCIDFEVSLSGSYDLLEFVVQYRESDLDFVSRLMQSTGIYYFFKHERTKHTLVLCDSLAAHDPVPGFESLPFFPPDRQRQQLVDAVDRWQATHRVDSGALATTDFDFKQPLAKFGVERKLPAQHPLGDFELYDYPGGYTQSAKGEALLRVQLEEQECLLEQFNGHSNSRGVAAGHLLTLKGHPITTFNREYLIVATTLSLENHDLESGSLGDEIDCQIAALDARVQFRSPRTVQKPVVRGAQTAMVVGPASEELWTDEYGRVKVKFHWDRAPGADEDSSCWIRVSQLWAGAGFGGIHIPRIGAEVIVEFLEGDPDRPLITGRVYNAVNKPPHELPLHHTQSGIRSLTTIDGGRDNFNELRFEDAVGQEELFLRAERDENVEVKRNRTAEIGQDDAIVVKGNRKLEVTGDLTVAVGDKGGTHHLEATRSVTATAAQLILLKCGESSIRIDGESITITSGTKSRLTVDANVDAQSSGQSSLLLDENVQLVASGEALLHLDLNVHAQSAAAAKLVLDANHTLDGASVLVRAPSVFEVKARPVKLI
jgi:type VI secretion system secreted protein VgrG